MEIKVYNANDLFSEGLWKIKVCGVKGDSRNGPVLRIPEPVLTTVKNPRERVLFFGPRDANPIFHLMESIWMIAGRRDVAFPKMFNSKFDQYSDDKEVFNAAYGYRMRHHFGSDQLIDVIRKLKDDPGTRQAVVQLWDSKDLMKDTLDRACNTQFVVEIVNGRLNMTTFNRSNDFWYGACGANIVHFTVIMEFIASAVGVEMGEYRSFTTNLHLYTELYNAAPHMVTPPDPSDYDHYATGIVASAPIMEDGDWYNWMLDAEEFCEDPFVPKPYRHRFFNQVAVPMAMVSKVRKDKTSDGRGWANRIAASDWCKAVHIWIDNREAAKQK